MGWALLFPTALVKLIGTKPIGCQAQIPQTYRGAQLLVLCWGNKSCFTLPKAEC